MNRAAATATAMFLGLTSLLVACSSSEEPKDPCEKNPKARGCTSNAEAPPASSGSAYTTPAPTATPPPVVPVDAGYDAPHKPDVGPAVPPEPQNNICQLLVTCCGRVDDLIERGACLAAAYSGNESTCQNAVVVYQVAGGCGNIFGGGYGGGGGGYGSDPCAYSSDPYCCDYYPSSPSCQYYYP